MVRQYLPYDVYEALQRRLHFLFHEFENIFVSFSGGKDSGLLLELTLEFQKKYYPERRIGVFHQDFEAQYTVTTEYVEATFERVAREAEPYWVCLPMATRTALSSFQAYWYPWDDTCPERWVRPMPRRPYVINMANNPITTYRYRMPQEMLARQFCRWYRLIHGGGPTVCLLGLRAQESLQRYSGILNKKHGYKDSCWIAPLFKNTWCASPMYDWGLEDVWHAYAQHGYRYNRLYDLYYMAGLRPDQMRVASPFNDCAKESLHLYRVLDPALWVRLLGRVQGANFTALYARTRAMGGRGVTLPEGQTWHDYTLFLLGTLPARMREKYVEKFCTSLRFWHTVGGGLEEETIRELEAHGYHIRRNGVSNYTVMRLARVVFEGPIPDDTDDIRSSRDLPSWKRMCLCILKNDHICRSMGFGLSREQQRAVDELREKYKKVVE